MQDRIELERQTSRKYCAGWDYLNPREHVGTARVLTHKPHGKPRDESKRSFALLLVTSKDTPENIEDAIQDTMQHSCRCEHDCCGHVHSYVSRIRRLKSGLYAVIENHYRNV